MRKLLLAFAVCGLLAAQEKMDSATGARFRSEELEKSQIMHTLHMLTDRYGPRVTGTPGHEAAAKWVVKQLTNSRAVSGTDSTSFNNAGLPGVGFAQDPIEYNTMTHHTNLDTYERIIPDDVHKAAAIVAAAVWHVANRDAMVPRFTKETMPAPPVEAR